MKPLKPLLAGLAFIVAGILLPPLGPAAGADTRAGQHLARGDMLPFPRSERAQSIWTSGTCWSECGAYCAWGLAGCLSRDAQGRCVKLTDRCDRYCQRSCRSSGGPLLPIDF